MQLFKAGTKIFSIQMTDSNVPDAKLQIRFELDINLLKGNKPLVQFFKLSRRPLITGHFTVILMDQRICAEELGKFIEVTVHGGYGNLAVAVWEDEERYTCSDAETS